MNVFLVSGEADRVSVSEGEEAAVSGGRLRLPSESVLPQISGADGVRAAHLWPGGSPVMMGWRAEDTRTWTLIYFQLVHEDIRIKFNMKLGSQPILLAERDIFLKEQGLWQEKNARWDLNDGISWKRKCFQRWMTIWWRIMKLNICLFRIICTDESWKDQEYAIRKYTWLYNKQYCAKIASFHLWQCFLFA